MASNFSKKHYIQIAEVLKAEYDSIPINTLGQIICFESVVARFIKLFEKDNMKFSRKEFGKAIYK